MTVSFWRGENPIAHPSSALPSRFLRRTGWLFLAAVVLLSLPATAAVSDADRALTQQVFRQLLAVTPAQHDIPWPPVLQIVDKDEINAYATVVKIEGKEQSVVVCFNGLLKNVIEGSAERMAYVLGHELEHHVLGHTRLDPAQTEFLKVTFSRDQELAADLHGMELALRAGYAYKAGLSAIRRMIDLGLNYSSFEGLAADHPSWLDRIAYLDKDQAVLWRAMSSFDNGVYFLLVQNYPLAERSFRQVLKDFPGSDEAQANLGYALLMQYADALNAEDLRHFNVGQIVTAGFYRRPKSLEGKARGINEELWVEAVQALNEAMRLNPGSSLAQASLGIAYLFRPAGKDPAKAAQLLEAAVRLAEKDAALDPVARLSIDINLAVAYAAQGENEKAMKVLGEAQASLGKAGPGAQREAGSLISALAYNRALLLAESPDSQRQRLALGEFESYLRQTGPALAWWQLAYQRYNTLCKQSGTAAKSESALLAQAGVSFRPLAGIEVGAAHAQLALGEKLTEARTQLGEAAAAIPAVRGSSLMALDYPAQGIRLLASDEVLAIVLSGDHAPALPVREMGLGGKSGELKIGMTAADLDRLLGDADYDFRQLVDPEVNYRFYSSLGVAVRVKSGQVIEMVISQVPKKKVGI